MYNILYLVYFYVNGHTDFYQHLNGNCVYLYYLCIVSINYFDYSILCHFNIAILGNLVLQMRSLRQHISTISIGRDTKLQYLQKLQLTGKQGDDLHLLPAVMHVELYAYAYMTTNLTKYEICTYQCVKCILFSFMKLVCQ